MTETSPEMQPSKQAPAVLIVADDADFAHTITNRWQSERTVPVFTLMTGDLCPGINPASYDLAIVGEVRPGLLPSVLTILEANGKPVVFVASDNKDMYRVRESHTRALLLRQHEGWSDALILIAGEVLRANAALNRAKAAEEAALRSETFATLGRYILDMRHSLNDALTSVLGNSELLLGQPGIFPATVREQIETIRNMSMRMNEILQRFSSLETELRYSERLSSSTNARARGTSAGL